MRTKARLVSIGLLAALTALPVFAEENDERTYRRGDENISACCNSPVVLQSEYKSSDFEKTFGTQEVWTTNDTELVEVIPLIDTEAASARVEVIKNLHFDEDFEGTAEIQHIWISDTDISETDPDVQSHELENGKFSNIETFEVELGNLNASRIPGMFECRICGFGKQMNSFVLGAGYVVLTAFIIMWVLAFA